MLVVMFLLTLAVRRTRLPRNTAAYVAGLLVTFLAAWTATGNSLFGIYAWGQESADLITGYSAMAHENAGSLYNYWLAALGIAAVVVLAYLATDRMRVSRRFIVVLIAVVTLNEVFREGFIRQPHDFLFFGALPLLIIAAAPGPHLRGHNAARQVFFASLLVVLVADGVPGILLRPVTGVHNWLATAHAIASTSERSHLEEQARTELQRLYLLPPQWLKLLAGHRVAAVPRGQPMAWTYPQLLWAPLPTIQEYTAYTPRLDQLDAAFFGSPRAPRWILEQAFGLDGRNPSWDSPAAELAMRCHYRFVASSRYLSLLERTPDICGAAKSLSTVRARLGQTVPVPSVASAQAVVATIVPSPSTAGRLAAALFKGATYSAVVNGATRYTYVPGTGRSPHLLSFPAADGTPLGFPKVSSLAVVSNDPWASSSTVQIRFSVVSLRGG